MGSVARTMRRAAAMAGKKIRRKAFKSSYQPPKQYTSFNIFTRDGQNITVTSKRPMTLEEAQYHYKALSISGNE